MPTPLKPGTTISADFDISARMRWDEPDETMPGHIPVTSEAVLRYPLYTKLSGAESV